MTNAPVLNIIGIGCPRESDLLVRDFSAGEILTSAKFARNIPLRSSNRARIIENTTAYG